jgi:heme-degrading monooxygenase HmoA
VARLLIIRPIHPLPGRVAEAMRWLEETEPIREANGQLQQYVLRGIVDNADYQLVQVWSDHASYQRWRATPDRARLAYDRQLYLTHDPAKLYEITAGSHKPVEAEAP